VRVVLPDQAHLTCEGRQERFCSERILDILPSLTLTRRGAPSL